MLAYYSGSDLSTLAQQLLEELDQYPPVNPLEAEIFVVQNHGMARWLSLYLAEQRGVAANLKFEFPAERIWKLIRLMNPDIPQTLPSDRAPMSWSILQILRNEDDTRLNTLFEYAEEGDPVRKEMRRWKLAERIADVFDQYLTYRPEMLVRWKREEYTSMDATERWQAVLWNKLTASWSKTAGSNYPHRAEFQQQLLEAINKETIDLGELPQRITVFGVSSMPPIYLKILVTLSKLVDVNFYSLSTAENISHPISESMGKTGREYRSLVKKYISENNITPKWNQLIGQQNTGESDLLHVFQTELITGEAGKNTASADDSIKIHSCHSERREVEVLYDQLLAMFDEDETLNPCDVLVLAPDMDSYAPEIEAVFGTVEQGLPEIPFHLTDRYGSQVNPVENTLTKLLQLVESRFTVTGVLDLLDSGPIQKRFEFSDDNLNTLEQWIDDTHIRWGIDKAFKAHLNQPESDSFTWGSGLNRMILAYAMKAEDDRLFEGIYPYHEVEQSEDALLVGRFSNLMESLFQFHTEAKKSRTLSGWATFLQDSLEVFFPDDAYANELQMVWQVISDLKSQQELSGFGGSIPFRVIRSFLVEELEKKTRGGGGGKGVTFGTMVQMRNIPYRVIYILGLNDGSFPRSEIPIAFDLMNRDPRTGDRSHSKEDRQLFLEILLAANERIHFSYTGQSNRQDATFPPSVLLRELMDYFSEHFDIQQEEIKTEHPLQPFSQKYFQTQNEQKGLFSYSEKHREIAENLLDGTSKRSGFMEVTLPEPGDEFRRLTLSELVRFFQHPAKYLMQNRLGIYLNQDKILEEDREPFQLEGLAGYHLGQELLDRYLNDQSLEHYKQVARATDMLPEGWPGEQSFSQKKSQVKDFGQNMQEILRQERLATFELDLTMDEYRITGKLDQVYSQEQVFYRFGSMRPKDLIELWIKHLAFQQVKPESHRGRSRLYTKGDKGSIEFFQLPELPEAAAIFGDLLRIYWRGLQENTYFFPEISFSFAHEVCFRNKDVEQGLKVAAPRWKSDYSPYPREGDDDYNKLITGGLNPMNDNRFRDVSISFWKPFFRVLNKEV